ncbi:MAG: ABC transporter substrate-binding protein, partial [Burkholderiales bacterium]
MINVRNAAAAVTVLMVATGNAAAQNLKNYPNKPIRFIVPFAPGGGVDIVARAVASRMTDIAGQQVLVDNR